MMNTLGWAAYYLNGTVFLKRYAYDPNATYPDFGCNTETYTDARMLSVAKTRTWSRLLLAVLVCNTSRQSRSAWSYLARSR